MDNSGDSYSFFKFTGSQKQVGAEYGRQMKDKLPLIIQEYLPCMAKIKGFNKEDLRIKALEWYYTIPDNFREEIRHFADGAGMEIENVIHFHFLEFSMPQGSVIMGNIDGEVWAACNTDRYKCTIARGCSVIIRSIDGRLPFLSIGLTGDIGADTGINIEKLFVHAQVLEARDAPAPGLKTIPCFFLVREALETCASFEQVEWLLKNYNRDMGMGLYLVDGKTGEYALYECGFSEFRRIPAQNSFITGTNHHSNETAGQGGGMTAGSSAARLMRMDKMVRDSGLTKAPQDLITILSDSDVEQHYAGDITTVYSTAIYSEKEIIWLACGNFPAAGTSEWKRVEWEW